MTDEACATADDFFVRLKRARMASFSSDVARRVATWAPTGAGTVQMSFFLPYHPVCNMSVCCHQAAVHDMHVYVRRASRCAACIEYTDLFTWDPENPTALQGCLAGDLPFHAVFHNAWYMSVWTETVGRQSVLLPMSSVLHDIVARTALAQFLVGVRPPFYAYGCGQRGVVIECPDQVVKAWPGMQPWLDALEKVKGFLVAPCATLFSPEGTVGNLSVLCWSHPDNPDVRWHAPMSALPVRMQVPGGVPWYELKGMRGWQRWFHDACRGTVPTNKSVSVRQWNTWITWCSLALSAWREREHLLEAVEPKSALVSSEACIAHLFSLAP